MSCKPISAKKTNLVLWVAHAKLLFFLARQKQLLKVLQDILKLTVIVFLVKLIPFLDLNVLYSCDRLTSGLTVCIEI